MMRSNVHISPLLFRAYLAPRRSSGARRLSDLPNPFGLIGPHQAQRSSGAPALICAPALIWRSGALLFAPQSNPAFSRSSEPPANSFHCIFSRFCSLGRRPAPGPLFRSLPTECTRIAIVELLTSSGTLIQHNQVENSLHTEAVSIQAKRCSGCVWAGYGCHSCFDCRSDSSRNSVLSIRSIQTFRTNAFLDLSCDSDRMLDLLSSVLKNSQSSWDS